MDMLTGDKFDILVDMQQHVEQLWAAPGCPGASIIDHPHIRY
jgi:hypothetical protein